MTVTVTADSASARVAVRDTGIGIDADARKALFKPYERSDRRSGAGLGLGLTLVKGIVEAHGGDVTVESEGRGAGSEFAFTIPLADAAPQQSAAERPNLPSRRRILVVDDQIDVATTFGAVLELLGQDVLVAHKGATALALARRHRPRVAFLDVSMPEMSGPELAYRLRQDFPPSELTLVAVTGYGEAYTRAESSLFEHHLLKPVTADALTSLLDMLTDDAGAGSAEQSWPQSPPQG